MAKNVRPTSGLPVACCHRGKKIVWNIYTDKQPQIVIKITNNFETVLCTRRLTPNSWEQTSMIKGSCSTAQATKMNQTSGEPTESGEPVGANERSNSIVSSHVPTLGRFGARSTTRATRGRGARPRARARAVRTYRPKLILSQVPRLND